RVAGVVGLANDIEVRLPVIDQRPDPEIARDVVAGIEKALPFSSKRIKALVGNGWITLEGEVEWNFQRKRAESAVRRVKGITGGSTLISFKPPVAPSDVRRKIEAAFKRSAEIDASNITVEAADGKVTLRGTVRSCAERQEAERAVWVAPRFTKVDNKITIDTSLSAESARRDSLSSVT
ncbi:MAG: BON domain-containing protein, partial [Burkholderiales bacterium]